MGGTDVFEHLADIPIVARSDFEHGRPEISSRLSVKHRSLRLVQYYFGTKEELLLAAMHHLAVQFGQRAMERIRKVKETHDPVSPREVIAAILAQSLPVDDERRTFTALNAAYFALSLTDPALAAGPPGEELQRRDRRGRRPGEVRSGRRRRARRPGPGRGSHQPPGPGQRPGHQHPGRPVLPGQAQAVIDYHLDRLFPRPVRRYDRFS